MTQYTYFPDASVSRRDGEGTLTRSSFPRAAASCRAASFTTGTDFADGAFFAGFDTRACFAGFFAAVLAIVGPAISGLPFRSPRVRARSFILAVRARPI